MFGTGVRKRVPAERRKVLHQVNREVALDREQTALCSNEGVDNVRVIIEPGAIRCPK